MTKTTKRIINKFQRKKDSRMFRILVSGVVAIAIIIIIVCLTVQRTYNTYSVIKTTPRTDSMTKGYIRRESDMIKYSSDGISIISKDLKTIWSASYNLKNPKVVFCGDYIAVADIGGKEVIVYDKKGNAKKVENTRDLCQIEISDSGMVAMLTTENMAYFITVANSSKKYIDIKTRIKEDGYPVDIAFSHDSQKLVTSYMKVEDGSINNYVSFYNFGQVGKNYESKMVKFESYGKVMVPKVDFLDRNTVAVFTQEKIIVYEMKEIPEELFKTKKYEEVIHSAICTQKYVGIVIEGEKNEEKTIHLWGKDGRKKLTKKINYEYDNIDIMKDDIVMNTNQDGMIVRISGKVKFKGDFKEEVDYVMPCNNKNKFYLITQQNIEKIKLKTK